MPMPTRMTRPTSTILARDESGRLHTLLLYPGAPGVPTRDDPTGRIPGPRRVVLEGGGEVERVAKGRYFTPWGRRSPAMSPERAVRLRADDDAADGSGRLSRRSAPWT